MGDGEFSWTQVAGKRQAGSTTSWLTQASTLRQHRCTKVVLAILVVGQVQLKGLTYALNPALFYSSDRHVAVLLAMTKHCCRSDCTVVSQVA